MKWSSSLTRYVFFLAIAVLLFVLGQVGLPVAHYFYDAVVIRDTGVFVADFADKPNSLSNFVTMAFRHHEGLIQFVILNFYCFFVGDAWPLNPATMQLPNTALALFAAVFCFLVARKIMSTRFAYCSVAVFVLGPWLAYTIRLPWYFDTLSSLLHFSTFYFLAGFLIDPESTFFRVAAPASFSLYLLTSLDWPSFVPCLIVFVILSGQLSNTLKNPFNFLPVFVIGLLIFWQVFLYFKIGESTVGFSRAVYPFWSFLNYIQYNSWLKIWDNMVLPWGPQMLLAGIGAAIYLFRIRNSMTVHRDKPKSPESNSGRDTWGNDLPGDPGRANQAQAWKLGDPIPNLWRTARIRRGFFDSMCLWLLVATPPLFISAGSATYIYVLAMPSALLSGLVLARMRYRWLIPCVLVLAISQIYFVTDKQFAFIGDKKQRILAAACHLIEKRPDLLTAARMPIIAGFDAAGVFQYARPTNIGCVVGGDFPVEYFSVRKQCLTSGTCSVTDLAGRQRTVVNPWFIIDSSPLSGRNPFREYWLALLQDPSIKWIAQFREATGEVIYIGEPGPGTNLSAYEAPLEDVNGLSEQYLEKYDRLKFLKRNLEYVYHY